MRYYLIPFEEVYGFDFPKNRQKEEGLANLRILSDKDR